MSGADPFAEMGMDLLVAPRRKRMAAADSRAEARAAALKNVRQEKEALKAAYHTARAEWIEGMYRSHGATGERLRRMVDWVNSLTMNDAGLLVETVAGEDWLLSAPKDLRFLALDLIHARIMRLKEGAGLDPMADPTWPDGQASAFQVIRDLLR